MCTSAGCARRSCALGALTRSARYAALVTASRRGEVSWSDRAVVQVRPGLWPVTDNGCAHRAQVNQHSSSAITLILCSTENAKATTAFAEKRLSGKTLPLPTDRSADHRRSIETTSSL